MMKMRFGIGLCLLCILLAGCGAQKDARPVIGIFAHDLHDPDWEQYAAALQQHIDPERFRAVILDARNDQARQEKQLEHLLSSGCAGVIVSPVMTAAADRICTMLEESEVPGVFLDRKPADRLLSEWGKLAYVGCDPAQMGTCQGNLILSLPDRGDINGDGEVCYVIFRGAQDQSRSALQAQSAVQTLQMQKIAVRELACRTNLKTREAGEMVCAGALERYAGELDVILCTEELITLGALDALEESNFQVGRDVYLLGADAGTETAALAGAGKLTGTVCCDLQGQAKTAVQVLEQLLRDEDVENLHFVDHIPVSCGVQQSR